MPIDSTMSIPPELLQFAGSLIAILVLAWLVKRMGMGAAPVLSDDAQAIAQAGEVADGFEPVAVSRDREGRGAVLRDGPGQIIVLKQHGSHFAGRLLAPTATAQAANEKLIVTSGEARFGNVTLQIPDAAYWADAINGLDRSRDA